MKRQSYTNKVQKLIECAKIETLALMKAKGVTRVNLNTPAASALASNKKGAFEFYNVTYVSIEKDWNGNEYLAWDCEAPTPWFFNPLLWIDIHAQVFKKLGEYGRVFLN